MWAREKFIEKSTLSQIALSTGITGILSQLQARYNQLRRPLLTFLISARDKRLPSACPAYGAVRRLSFNLSLLHLSRMELRTQNTDHNSMFAKWWRDTRLIALLLTITTWTNGQSNELLRRDIERIITTKKAKVGVAIIGDNGKDTLSLNGDHHFPMQSVFKFHIALTTLSQIEQGKFSLDQLIKIDEKELLPDLYSPLREKHPNGATLRISEILEYTVSQSDNVGCDVLLRLIGGPQAVENSIVEKGFRDFSVKINEEAMQKNWDLQFLNWTTPKTASQILASFYNNDKQFLSTEHHDFIWTTMKRTETGKNRLKGHLPEGTVVAHKTGWSGTNKEGITAAVNDIGIVFLLNGSHFFISVFVTDSKEDIAANEKIIADISKVTWDYFNKEMK